MAGYVIIRTWVTRSIFRSAHISFETENSYLSFMYPWPGHKKNIPKSPKSSNTYCVSPENAASDTAIIEREPDIVVVFRGLNTSVIDQAYTDLQSVLTSMPYNNCGLSSIRCFIPIPANEFRFNEVHEPRMDKLPNNEKIFSALGLNNTVDRQFPGFDYEDFLDIPVVGGARHTDRALGFMALKIAMLSESEAALEREHGLPNGIENRIFIRDEEIRTEVQDGVRQFREAAAIVRMRH